MPSTRETILQALHMALQTQPASVLRGEVLPERVPAAGLLILRDGDLLTIQARADSPGHAEDAVLALTQNVVPKIVGP